ncbi:MAG: VCBS repeat-containing protein [Pseudomonadales bacterium]|nr:VCBS repeat-containing protein [Pseudomonadales bacterium]
MFQKTEFNVNFDITHNIIAGDFLNRPGKELLILGVNASAEKIMTIYGFEKKSETYVLLIEKTIPKDIVVFDTISDAEGRRLVLLLSAKILFVLDFNKEDFQIIGPVESIYLNKRPQFVARKSLVQDLNGDGLDDIAISGFSDLRIFLQQVDGHFLRNDLVIEPIVDMGSEQIAFAETPFFNVDANNDDLADIVVVRDGHLAVFEQSQNRVFLNSSVSVTLPIPASRMPWWYLRDPNGETADQSELQHKKVESVMDINGDDVIDLLIMNTQSSGLLDRDNRYEVYYGRMLLNNLTFETSLATDISSKGTLTAPILEDVNFDGRKEFFVMSFDIGLAQIIGAMISGKIKQDVFVFSLDDNDLYGKQPNFYKSVGLSFSLSSGSIGQAVTLLVDIDGDKLKDLILSQGDQKLAIYSGEATKRQFKQKKLQYKIKLPIDGEMVVATHLSSLLRQDIIIRYGRQDEASLRRKVVILSSGERKST